MPHIASQRLRFARRWGLSDTLSRSTVKTLSYRCVGSSVTFMIAFVFTGEIVIAASVSVTEFLLKPSLYWLHERVWNKITWGKK
jgi:uncharacterized membrane protein